MIVHAQLVSIATVASSRDQHGFIFSAIRLFCPVYPRHYLIALICTHILFFYL